MNFLLFSLQYKMAVINQVTDQLYGNDLVLCSEATWNTRWEHAVDWSIQRELFYSFLETIRVIIHISCHYCWLPIGKVPAGVNFSSVKVFTLYLWHEPVMKKLLRTGCAVHWLPIEPHALNFSLHFYPLKCVIVNPCRHISQVGCRFVKLWFLNQSFCPFMSPSYWMGIFLL